MTKTQVLALLKKNRCTRGMAHWEKRWAKQSQLTSYGIGLTRLRQLAKVIGRDHKLARQLWKTDNYDAKIVGLLIDDPKQISREQVEEQVEHLDGGNLAHVFASCSSTLAKAPIAFELANDWMASQDPMRRQCGYSLLYELSKKNVKDMDDAYLLDRINHIRQTIRDEQMWVQEAMKVSLMGIGKRTKQLNRAAIAAVKAIGKLDIDYGDDNNCEPVDVLKHLTSDHLKKKFGT